MTLLIAATLGIAVTLTAAVASVGLLLARTGADEDTEYDAGRFGGHETIVTVMEMQDHG